MANDRWRVLRKVQWKQVIDPLDGSYVGWHARHHKNDKCDRYRRWKRASKQGKLPYHAKFGEDIKAVHGGKVTVSDFYSIWGGDTVVTKSKGSGTINIYTDLERGDDG